MTENNIIKLGSSEKYKSAFVLLGNASRNGYERITKDLIKEFDISKNRLPSYYKLTKDRPKIEGFKLNNNNNAFINNKGLIVEFLQEKLVN